jgi:hypothetical protein
MLVLEYWCSVHGRRPTAMVDRDGLHHCDMLLEVGRLCDGLLESVLAWSPAERGERVQGEGRP